MKKKAIIYFLTFSFLFTQNSYAHYLSEYRDWLVANNLNQFLDLDNTDCQGCDDFDTRTIQNCYDKNGQKEQCTIDEWDPKWQRNKWIDLSLLNKKLIKKRNKLGKRFKWDYNPSLEELHYQVFHYLEDDKGWSKQEINKSTNPYVFEFDLREDKEVDKQLKKSGLLSYLMFENNKIVIDKKSPQDRLGNLFNDKTYWTSASVGKSLTSYVTGQAICDGYIDNIDVKLNDWPLLKDTLFENITLINLLNMAAGDQEFIKGHFRKDIGIKGRERNVNVNTIKYHMEGTFKGSKPKKNYYNYSNFNTNIILNYVWYKSNGDFQKIVDKVFKDKAKIEENVFFLKNNNRTVKNKYEVTDESGPLRYSFRANRYDYLRIAKAMMDDWQNDTCVGRYLKEINDRKIKKNKEYQSKYSAYTSSKSYGGQFHLNFPGFKDRNIFGLDGAYGQSILIDMDRSKIIVINAVHGNYNWRKIGLGALK